MALLLIGRIHGSRGWNRSGLTKHLNESLGDFVLPVTTTLGFAGLKVLVPRESAFLLGNRRVLLN